MNLLGIGPAELILIVVLALIVLGPEKLPEVMAQVGKAIAEFRRATAQLSDEFNRTIQAELNETRSVVEQSKEVFREAGSSVDEAVSGTAAAMRGEGRLPEPAPSIAAQPPRAPAGVAPDQRNEQASSSDLLPPY